MDGSPTAVTGAQMLHNGRALDGRDQGPQPAGGRSPTGAHPHDAPAAFPPGRGPPPSALHPDPADIAAARRAGGLAGIASPFATAERPTRVASLSDKLRKPRPSPGGEKEGGGGGGEGGPPARAGMRSPWLSAPLILGNEVASNIAYFSVSANMVQNELGREGSRSWRAGASIRRPYCTPPAAVPPTPTPPPLHSRPRSST